MVTVLSNMAAKQCLIFMVYALFTTSMASRMVRNVVSGRSEMWPRGEIVYTISSIFDDAQKKIIKDAMKEIEVDASVHGLPCVEFKAKTGSYEFASDYVQFTSSGGSECIYDVGRQHGRQATYIGGSCMTRSEMLSVLLGILGLYHEHRRPDRDNYIEVHMDNVIHEFQTLYSKLDPSVTDLLGLRYDYDSVTHFGPYEHAVNQQKPTITTNTSGVTFGNKKKLSVYDVEKIQKLYNCGLDTSHIQNSPPFPVECHFENLLCNIADDYTDDFQWYRQDTPLSETGPSGDHSTGTGFYVYANGTSHFNMTARLLSAKEITPGEYCISINYYINGGKDSASLTVSQYDYVTDTETQIVTTSINSGEQSGGLWYKLEKSYTNLHHKWRLYIDATILKMDGGVAVDDILVYPGQCS